MCMFYGRIKLIIVMLHVYINVRLVTLFSVKPCVSWITTYSTAIAILYLFYTSMSTRQV